MAGPQGRAYPRRGLRDSFAAAGFAGTLIAGIGAGASWSQAPRAADVAPQIANSGLVNQGTPACASCHGFRGEGIKVQNGPRLAGLDADYMERQLDAFSHGRRDSSVMVAVARSLTEEQRAALAQYYAGLPPTSEGAGASGGALQAGRAVAHEGNWSEKVPPCASCHAADGLGVNSLAPPLAGQRADYIERQMIRFRQNERRDDPLGLMRGIASHLSMAEIRAVAAYYATLPARAAAPGAAKPNVSGVRR
jgi:cytochrome c553